MKEMCLLFWQYRDGSNEGNGTELLSRHVANNYIRDLNKEFPYIIHWVKCEHIMSLK